MTSFFQPKAFRDIRRAASVGTGLAAVSARADSLLLIGNHLIYRSSDQQDQNCRHNNICHMFSFPESCRRILRFPFRPVCTGMHRYSLYMSIRFTIFSSVPSPESDNPMDRFPDGALMRPHRRIPDPGGQTKPLRSHGMPPLRLLRESPSGPHLSYEVRTSRTSFRQS